MKRQAATVTQLELNLWQPDPVGPTVASHKATPWVEATPHFVMIRDKSGNVAIYTHRGARELLAALQAAIPPMYGDHAAQKGR